MEEKVILSALANNHPGVLLRITGLFNRRGFNIESLTACTTEDPKTSRMTIAMTGDRSQIRQVMCQLMKLEDVKKVSLLTKEDASHSELLLVKIRVDNGQRSDALHIAYRHGARILDISHHTITIEATGQSGQIDELIQNLQKYPVVEMARTGITALERGDGSIADHDGTSRPGA
ncbi:acetolactate synthase small subunit [Solibaculum mannosilyticum]|uniref:acetolactate synthase small subunit n=1 Tax=Solibaculum mannosilyticum TaxID=2780922 RepID=UPI0034ADCA4F